MRGALGAAWRRRADLVADAAGRLRRLHERAGDYEGDRDGDGGEIERL